MHWSIQAKTKYDNGSKKNQKHIKEAIKENERE